ncbi:SPOR domain-containing protein [Kitasatospora sp. NPDC058162]|uniref:SPOR domain-containing protein n=1 Tax=Kitasatospora sp. NPDC058162 TaxID=3346362 RepID=UPI0036D8778B
MTDHAPAPQPAPEPHDQAPAAPAAPESPWAAVTVDDPQPEAAQAPTTAEAAEEQAARRTRRRKAAVRWGSAVLVFALAGTGAALAVTAPERTDIPGLATAGDGRYTFPPLALPPLPSGKAAPDLKDKGRDKTKDKDAGLHLADLRYLLLPAPKEAGGSVKAPVFPSPTAPASPTAAPSDAPSATASPSAPPTLPAVPDGAAAPANWVSCGALEGDAQNAARLRALLLQNACRAATVREWTASDGTSTRIRLLRFGSSAEAWDTFSRMRSEIQLKAAPDARTTTAASDSELPDGVEVTRKESRETVGKDVPTTRLAYVSASDVVAVITMTNPRGVPVSAFRQVVDLQCDLLA